MNDLGIPGVGLYIRMKIKRWINRAISTGGRIPLEGKQAADITPRWGIKGWSKLPRRKWSGPEISILERRVDELSREFYLSLELLLFHLRKISAAALPFFSPSYKIVKSSDFFNPLELFLFLLALLFSKFSKRARFKNCEGITRRGTFKITTCYDSSRSLKRSRRNE